MTKLTLLATFIFLTLITISRIGLTQTAEREGAEIWQDLQNKKLQCSDVSEQEFEILGEYFMEQMMGANHKSIDANMMRLMGEEGLKQMHLNMGKRLSGCETQAVTTPMIGMMTMPGMMGAANWFPPYFSWGISNVISAVTLVLLWLTLILLIISLIKWLLNHSRKK